MDNYYQILNIDKDASLQEIVSSYKKQISSFNNLPFLNESQVLKVKQLKKALYILSNPPLREKYNKAISNDSFMASNDVNHDSFDSVFNVDNSWMNKYQTNDNTSKKDKFNNNVIGDRVFSMNYMNKRPGYGFDMDNTLRLPQQGREDKSQERLNNQI